MHGGKIALGMIEAIQKTRDRGEPQLDVSGAERSQFLAWFPADPELDRLVRAFEVGIYAFVREHAPKLAQSEDEQVRAAARELLARIEPDPLMKYLLAAAVALHRRLRFDIFAPYRRPLVLAAAVALTALAVPAELGALTRVAAGAVVFALGLYLLELRRGLRQVGAGLVRASGFDRAS